MTLRYFSLTLASFCVSDLYPAVHRVLTNQIKVTTSYMPIYTERATTSALHPKTLCETLLLCPSITKYVSSCPMKIK